MYVIVPTIHRHCFKKRGISLKYYVALALSHQLFQVRFPVWEKYSKCFVDNFLGFKMQFEIIVKCFIFTLDPKGFGL